MIDPSKYPLGLVVKNIAGLERDEIGHVVGFSRNVHGELLIKVQWDDEKTRTIHPANLIRFPKDAGIRKIKNPVEKVDKVEEKEGSNFWVCVAGVIAIILGFVIAIVIGGVV